MSLRAQLWFLQFFQINVFSIYFFKIQETYYIYTSYYFTSLRTVLMLVSHFRTEIKIVITGNRGDFPLVESFKFSRKFSSDSSRFKAFVVTSETFTNFPEFIICTCYTHKFHEPKTYKYVILGNPHYVHG